MFGITGGSLHDPCAVAALIDPTLIEFEPMHVAVELKGEHTYGMTVAITATCAAWQRNQAYRQAQRPRAQRRGRSAH
ncbi:MAG: nucleoside hydrolase [Caldilineaceae bacterium]